MITRPWGTGTISPHRGRFRARLPGDRADVGIYDTRAQAASALAAALARLAIAPIETPTFAAWGAAWLAERDVRPGTLARDRSRWRTYVEAAELGRERPGAITPGDVERWLTSLSHLAAQTRQNALGLVKQALAAWARKHGRKSPAEDVALGKRARARTDDGWDWLRSHEVGAVLACPLLPKQRAIFTVAIFSGLRAGELYGLRWDDVDLERGVLHVRHSRGEAPKSGKPREVPMLVPVRVALERWRDHYEAQAIRSHLGLVWPARDGGHHSAGYDADWPAVRACARLRRPVRFHDLRHTFASHVLQGTWAPRWVARPLRIEEVRDLLGHGDITTTQRYAHLCRDGVAALVAQPVAGHRPGHNMQPPPRFELGTYGLRRRKRGTVAGPGKAMEAGSVPSFVPRLAAASDRLLAALDAGDPWRDQRALDLIDAVEDVLDELAAVAAKVHAS